jgi:hypothetical protein
VGIRLLSSLSCSLTRAIDVKRESFSVQIEKKNGSIIQIRQISKYVRKRAEYCARRRPIKKDACTGRIKQWFADTHTKRESLKKRARAHLAES